MTKMTAAVVVFTEAEAAQIAELQKKNGGPDLWADARLADIKGKAKKHYVEVQQQLCCYCRHNQLTTHGRAWDLEHIVARTSHPQFMFEPKNLAASCIDCNQAKSDKVILVGQPKVRYPTSSEKFRIVHPHFDRYEEHIGRGTFLYWAITEKGKYTIYACDLLRFSAEAAKLRMDPGDSRFEKEVEELLFAKDLVGRQAKLASISVYVEHAAKQAQVDS